MILIGRWLYTSDPRPGLNEYYVADEVNGVFHIKDWKGIVRSGHMLRVDMDVLAMSREQLLETIMEQRREKQTRP